MDCSTSSVPHRQMSLRKIRGMRGANTKFVLAAMTLAVLTYPAASSAEVVYDNTATVIPLNHGFGLDEGGDQVTLAGTNRAVTSMTLSLQAAIGSADVVVRIYANTGPAVLGLPRPDDMPLWESSVLTIPTTEPSGFNAFTVIVPSVVVPETFTWTIQRVDGSGLAIRRYGPPTVGTSGDFFWQHTLSSDTWSPVNNSSVEESFYALIEAEPVNVDTDGDGLFDSTELDIAAGSGCPDPLNPDSDGDTLSDGAEVDAGTDPCSADTDGDNIPDDLDPFPTDPEGTGTFVENEIRERADEVAALDLGLFTGPNNNANKGRRNALHNRLSAAANEVADEDYDKAADILNGVLDRMGGQDPPPDWIDASDPTVAQIAADIAELIEILELLAQ